MLFGCLLLCNAGSLFLVGSNLTNLIVLGHLHLSGAGFLLRMWASALAALAVTAAVVAAFERRALGTSAGDLASPRKPVIGLGLLGVVLATVLVVALPSPALPVAAAGAVIAGFRLVAGKTEVRKVARVVGAPTLAGLFGVAVALGTLGRLGSGRPCFSPTLTCWVPLLSRPPARSWSTTCPPLHCSPPARQATPSRC